MAKEDTIRVLMLGARRSGKSSMLAGLVNSMTNGAFSEILRAEDKTDYEPGEKRLADKVAAMRDLINRESGKEISPDTDSTIKFKDYRIELSVPERSGSTTIVFTDGNGEFLEMNNEHISELEEKVAQYDIILIAIDTPFLMEATNLQNKLCRESTNKKYNQIQAVQRVLTCVNDNDGQIARQIIFVPIKCEKWIHEGRFDDIVEHVRQAYAVPLANLSGYKNVEIGILPAQTLGNLEFTTHRKGYVVTDGRQTERCSFVDDDESRDTLILADGRIMKRTAEHMVNLDARSMSGNILIPYSWFRIIGHDYNPSNCEMLAYHILRFALTKTVDTKKKKSDSEEGGFFAKHKWLKIAAIATVAVSTFGVGFAAALGTFAYLYKRMGTIDLEALGQALKQMKSKHDRLDKSCDMHMIQKSRL